MIGGSDMRRRILVSLLAFAAGLAVTAVVGTAEAGNPPLPGRCAYSYVHCPPWTTGLWIEHPGSRLEYGADVEYASTADRAKVHLWQYYSNPNQDWYKATVDGFPDEYVFINKNSGKCLDKSMDHGNNWGAQIYQYECFFTANQRWKLTSHQVGQITAFRVESVAAPGQCLDVKDYQYRIGAAIQSWPCDWMWNQDWWIWDPPF